AIPKVTGDGCSRSDEEFSGVDLDIASYGAIEDDRAAGNAQHAPHSDFDMDRSASQISVPANHADAGELHGATGNRRVPIDGSQNTDNSASRSQSAMDAATDGLPATDPEIVAVGSAREMDLATREHDVS